MILKKQIIIASVLCQQQVALNLQPTKMNNNSSLNYHCFSCGKQFNSATVNSTIKKHDYPICNQTTDTISLQKHILCHTCYESFQNIRKFIQKYKLQWFDKQFKMQKIIDPTFIKMSHVQNALSFIKQNRKSQINQIAQPYQQKMNSSSQLFYINKDGVKLNVNLPNDLYNSIINQNIQQNHLHNVHWLPNTVQYLIYMTAAERMKSQQRKQRVKNVLVFLSYCYFIDQQDLRYLAIMAQILLCFMDQSALLKILDPLLKSFIKNNISLNFFMSQDNFDDLILQKSFQERVFKYKNIECKPDKILQNIVSILILSDFFKDSKLKKHIEELKSLTFKQQHQQNDELILKVNSTEKVFENYLKKNIPQTANKLSKLSYDEWQQVIQIKKQKNKLNLIIKTIKKQQQQNSNIAKQLQNKHKKQKDQYVNKIIKLNNKIQELESQLKSNKQLIFNLNKQNVQKQRQIELLRKKQSASPRQNQNIRSIAKENDDQCKSNPQLNGKQQKSLKSSSNTNKFKQQKQQTYNSQPKSLILLTQNTQINQNSQTEGIKKHKSQIQNIDKQNYSNKKNMQQECLDYLKSILSITDLMSFNNKVNKKSSSFPLSQLPNSIKQLSQLIIQEINQIQKRVSILIQQNKKFKQESSRVLSILKRKQQQWLPLFHQKDQIISLYQKALICLQNGIILAQQPLSSRIRTILQKVSKLELVKFQNQDDQISLRDSVLEIQQPFNHQNGRSSQSSANKQYSQSKQFSAERKSSFNKQQKSNKREQKVINAQIIPNNQSVSKKSEAITSRKQKSQLNSSGQKTIKKKIKKQKQKQKQSQCLTF